MLGFEFIDVYAFINGRAVVWMQKNYPNGSAVQKYALIDEKGEFILPPIYDKLLYSGGDTAIVNLGFPTEYAEGPLGQWGVVDMDCQVLIPLKYTDITGWRGTDCFSVEFNERWGVINTRNDIVIPFEYDWIAFPDELGFIHAVYHGKHGCLDKDGNTLIPFIYDEMKMYPLSQRSNNWICVILNDKPFYIDRKGNRMLL